MAKQVPFDFVLDELANLLPLVKPMFGAYGIYTDGKLVLILRNREQFPDDNGLWIATKAEHHPTLRAEFPSLHSIYFFDCGETNWQVLPMQADGFEEDALRVCALIRKGDPRIGTIPKSRKAKTAKKKKPAVKKLKKKSTRK